MAKNSLIQLYQFKDFDMDKFVKKYLYEISEHKEIEDIDMFTSGTMYVSCQNDGVIKDKEDEKTIVECRFNNVKIGELYEYKIKNTKLKPHP